MGEIEGSNPSRSTPTLSSDPRSSITLLPIKKKPGCKLTDAQKEYVIHSKIRVYVENAIRRVKTYRIMGDRFRNSLRKYDLASSIVCGLVNERALARIAAVAA